MKTKAFSLLLICAMLLLSMIGCGGGGNDYVGAWVPVDSTTAPSGFPDKMVLREDYTGAVDGVDVNWATHDGGFSITANSLGTIAYSSEIEGDILFLSKNSETVEYKRQK